jgi:hypothetical protein
MKAFNIAETAGRKHTDWARFLPGRTYSEQAGCHRSAFEPLARGVSNFPKGKGFACPRCKALMDEVVTIEPLANEAGLIGYECPACRYVTSVILQPLTANPSRKTPPRK